MNHPIFFTSYKSLEDLKNAPEDGMGWQYGELSSHGTKQKTFIINCLFALHPELPLKTGINLCEEISSAPEEIEYDATELTETFFKEISKGIQDPEGIKVPEELKKLQGVNISIQIPTNNLSPIWEKTLTNPQVFYRYCAIDIDPRIGTDGSVKPNTYATTENEKPHVPSGLAAIGRFALPIRASAKYLRRIVAPIGTLMRYGTVGPNFGLSGGGVETLFPKGLPPGSADTTIIEIPEM